MMHNLGKCRECEKHGKKMDKKNDAVLFVYEIGLHCIVRENPAGGLRVIRSTEKLCREE